MSVIFSPEAEADLQQIGDYIAEDNPRRAASFVQELIEHATRIIDARMLIQGATISRRAL